MSYLWKKIWGYFLLLLLFKGKKLQSGEVVSGLCQLEINELPASFTGSCIMPP